MSVSRKPEIWNSQIKMTIEQNILRFKISVSDTLIHKILDSWKKLLNIRSTNFRTECALLWYKVKQISPLCKLQNYSRPFLLGLTIYLDFCQGTEIYHVNEMFEV